ncbi:lysophospholipase L1-like esterase [Roseimicrobium gellanilyticum]|uniref:Lysophospholipase L1-like esterase n=1 Tax=Roseimicrobium gellanilyticum TaxID=748857 RepID=A0A366HWW3_9BACT|nr:exo-alpha-sialidase [Roseimicrobium gellanilyticum]RBP47975.1 lysophospholipase L1-like esterase [Roseimicrobium gellanilyticum]
MSKRPLLSPTRHLTAFAAAVLTSALFSSASPAAEPVTVVAFGDSTTAPRGNLTVYSAILQEELRNVNVINAGIGGNTTEMARKRFEKDVLAYKPKLVVLQFGINDAAVDVWKTPPATEPRVKLERYTENLNHFVKTLKDSGAQVIVMGPNPLRWTDQLKKMYGKPPYDPGNADGFNGPLVKYNEAAAKVAQAHEIRFIDTQLAYRDKAQEEKLEIDKLLLDGMHPNDEGHRLVARLLRERILATEKAAPLGIQPGPVWKSSGETVEIGPECTDISLDAAGDKVLLGCGLTKLSDGSMMAVYSTPSSYYAKAGQTWIAARVTKDGGKTWSTEQEIARNADCQASHPSVLRTKDGTLHIFYLAFKTWKWKDLNPTPEAQSDVYTARSTDDGKTWTTPQPIFDGYSGATNGAIETKDGKIMVPYSHYVNDPGRLVSRVSISADGGKTWTLGAPIDIGGAGDHEGALEPGLLELKDGRVWMLIRTTRGQFWDSYSADGGATWTPAKAGGIEAPSAPGHMTRLSDDRIALVWNKKAKNRRELYVAVSADEGSTWSPPVAVARGKSTTYPFIIEGSPGELWIGYHDVPKGWNFPRARHLKIQAPK